MPKENEMTHTPEPWSYSMVNNSNYVRIYLHGLGRKDKILGGDSLAGYCGEANARLIIAAPKLLRLLRHLHDLQNGPPLEKYRDEWERVMAEVAELLNKLGG